MSRSGTLTDNVIIEALNGWMEDEFYRDYDLNQSGDAYWVIYDYINHFNLERLAYALHYKTPAQYKHDLGF